MNTQSIITESSICQNLKFPREGTRLSVALLSLLGFFFSAENDIYALVESQTVKKLSIQTQLERSIKKQIKLPVPKSISFITREKYSREKIIASLAQSNDNQLRKLSQYKNLIHGTYGKQMMIFVHMPNTETGVKKLAINMKNIIAEYKRNSILPVFLFEPFDDNLNEIHFGELKKGSYDASTRLLFKLLRDTYGVSSDDIGMIVPYPEINTPAYKRIGFQPQDFSGLVNRFFREIRSVYPNIRSGLLLDSKSYAIGENWGDGGFESFLPYIEDITPGSIDSFGIQGFPWVSNNEKIKAYDPKVYLPFTITDEAARKLSVKSVWMNTGVMRKKFRENTVIISPETSEKILSDTLDHAKLFQNKGYSLFLNIFAQNKFHHYEATDWSFLGDIRYEKVFERFLLRAEIERVEVGIYDK